MNEQSQADLSQMTREQLERYFEEKADDYAKNELSRHMARQQADRVLMRTEALETLLRPNSKGPGRLVLLHIKGRQLDGAGEAEEITYSTQARYYKKNNKHYLIYKEPGEAGLGETTTTISYAPEMGVRLLRSGEQRVKMHFVEGKREMTHYATPFGPLRLGFYTNEVDFRLHAKGGRLKLSYNLDANVHAELNMKLELSFTFL